MPLKMWHRLAHRVGRFVASADRRRGQVSQRLEHKNSDSPTSCSHDRTQPLLCEIPRRQRPLVWRGNHGWRRMGGRSMAVEAIPHHNADGDRQRHLPATLDYEGDSCSHCWHAIGELRKPRNRSFGPRARTAGRIPSQTLPKRHFGDGACVLWIPWSQATTFCRAISTSFGHSRKPRTVVRRP